MKSKFTIRLIAVSLFVLAINLTACKKEKIKGCKIDYATNYNSKAEEDDGSCTYEAKVIFWQTASKASSWSSSGVTGLKFYVGGNYIGSCLSNEYSATPSCSDNGQASVLVKMGNESEKVYTYDVKDQNNNILYTGALILNAPNCSVNKLN